MIKYHNSRPRQSTYEPLESRRLLSTYYVSASSGSDGNTGASDAAAFKTLQKAANAVKAGDTVYVRAGTYSTGMNLYGHAGGTATAPIRFLADAGAVITHSAASGSNAAVAGINIENTRGIVIDGFTVRSDGSMTKAGIRSAMSPNVVIRDSDVSGAPTGIFASRSDNIVVENNVSRDNTREHGIYVNGSANYVIRGNTTYGNNWNGIHTNVMDGVNQVNTGGLLENNVVRNNKLAGMDLTGMANATVRNNLVYGNGRHAVVLQNSNGNAATTASHDVTFVNNTFDARAGSSAYAVQISAVSAQPSGSAWSGNDNNVTLFNNILIGNASSGNGSIGNLSGTIAASFRSDENIVADSFRTGGTQRSLSAWRSATGEDANSIMASGTNLFVDTTAGNYRLRAGAVAIDAGVGSFNGKSAAVTDFQGEQRPQGGGYDIGYDEVAGSSPVDTTPPAITSLSPAAGATDVVPDVYVMATYDEPLNTAGMTYELRDAAGAAVSATTRYDSPTRAVILDPTNPLAAGVTYMVTLSGVKDAAGNTAAPASWSFTTATAAPSAAVSDDFNGTTLSSTWTATAHNPGGTAVVAGGMLAARAMQVRTTQTVTGPVEARVQFTSRWQSFGLATDLSTATGNSWAIFGTKETASTLYARTNVNGLSRIANLGATPAGFHTYRVAPIAGSGGFDFFIDGTKVASIAQALPSGAPVKLVMSDMIGASELSVDWARVEEPSDLLA